MSLADTVDGLAFAIEGEASRMALREPTLYILAALANGRLHGYGILASVEELSGGRVRLSTGTLYGALDRLHSDGHVALAGEESDGGPPRRYYELTDAGRGLLSGEIARLDQLVTTIRAEVGEAWA